MAKAKLKEVLQFMYDQADGETDPSSLEYEFDNDGGAVSVVDSEGGYEGAGEYAHIVFRVKYKSETYYVMFTGSYSSWTDTEWDEPKFVEPYEVTVTKYKDV